MDNLQPESQNTTGASSPDQQPASTAEKSLLFLVMLLVLLADHASQLIIESWLELNQSWAPFPQLANIFQFTHVSNTGAAFGLFSSGSSFLTIIAILVVVVIIVYNYRLPANHLLFRVALGLQLGGALGNLIDRLRLGHVTDFLDVGPIPVFNIADMAIVTGVILLGFLMLFEEGAKDSEEEGEDAGGQAHLRADEPADDSGMLLND